MNMVYIQINEVFAEILFIPDDGGIECSFTCSLTSATSVNDFVKGALS